MTREEDAIVLVNRGKAICEGRGEGLVGFHLSVGGFLVWNGVEVVPRSLKNALLLRFQDVVDVVNGHVLEIHGSALSLSSQHRFNENGLLGIVGSRAFESSPLLVLEIRFVYV